MYAIYLDDKPLYAPGSSTQLVINPTLEEGVGKSGSLTFDVPVSNPYYNDIVEMKSKVRVMQDGKERWAGRVLTEGKDWYNTKAIVCEGELGYFVDSTQRPYDEDLTDRGYIEYLVSVHNDQVDKSRRFEVGVVDVEMETEDTDRTETEYKKTKAVFDDLASKYGGYFIVRKEDGIRYLDYVTEYTSVATQDLVFGRNILGLKGESKATDMATAIIPLGAAVGGERLTIEAVNGGLDYIQDNDAVDRYGFILAPVTFDDIDDDDELLAKGREHLAKVSTPAITVDSTAIDRSIMPGEALEAYRVGDQVHCVSPPHGLDTYLQANNIRLPLAEPDKMEISLGADVQTSTGRSTNMANQVQAIKTEIDELKQIELPAPQWDESDTDLFTPKSVEIAGGLKVLGSERFTRTYSVEARETLWSGTLSEGNSLTGITATELVEKLQGYTEFEIVGSSQYRMKCAKASGNTIRSGAAINYGSAKNVGVLSFLLSWTATSVKLDVCGYKYANQSGTAWNSAWNSGSITKIVGLREVEIQV